MGFYKIIPRKFCGFTLIKDGRYSVWGMGFEERGAGCW